MNNAETDIQRRIETATDRLARAINEHRPTHVFGLFSGGHDSLSATYIASLSQFFTAAVHIDTGIGIEATRDFVRATCAERGWPLLEYRAVENKQASGKDDPMIYEDLVRRYGFPGPGGHGLMYVKLKERQLRRLERYFGATVRGKKKRRIMYVSGCRSQESTRRMGNTVEVQIVGRVVWCAPIHDWSKIDTSRLISHVGLKRNWVVDLIHKSGECLCGAFAKPGELAELSLWPETRPCYERIRALESEVAARFPWGWEGRPPRPSRSKSVPGILCQSCILNRED